MTVSVLLLAGSVATEAGTAVRARAPLGKAVGLVGVMGVVVAAWTA